MTWAWGAAPDQLLAQAKDAHIGARLRADVQRIATQLRGAASNTALKQPEFAADSKPYPRLSSATTSVVDETMGTSPRQTATPTELAEVAVAAATSGLSDRGPCHAPQGRNSLEHRRDP